MEDEQQWIDQVPLDQQEKVRQFFMKYDPDRLIQHNFNVLIKYIAKKGFDELDKKLKEKYGINITEMNQENNQEDNINSFKSPEELNEMPNPRTKRKNIVSIRLRAGLAPGESIEEDEARADIFDKLTLFYRKHNPERLHQGIGEVVEYALKFGEHKLNAKLFQQYGEDLSFPSQSKQSEINDNLGSPTFKKRTSFGEKDFGNENSRSSSNELREELTNFFRIVEPDRAELDMNPLVEYANTQGLDKLNEKLYGKYGTNLQLIRESRSERRPVSKVSQPSRGSQPSRSRVNEVKRTKRDGNDTSGLPRYVRLMLERFYARYDQRMLDEYNLDRVCDWTVRNGIDKLNIKLKEKYGLSLQSFIVYANEMRDDLIDFYRRADKNKLVVGIRPIFDWGLRNGRTALNEKLKQKYGMDLDDDYNLADELSTSASQIL